MVSLVKRLDCSMWCVCVYVQLPLFCTSIVLYVNDCTSFKELFNKIEEIKSSTVMKGCTTNGGERGGGRGGRERGGRERGGVKETLVAG